MPQKPYVYRKFPSWRYKPNCRPIIVHNQEEDDAIQAKGWYRTPKAQAVDILSPETRENSEAVEILEKMVGSIAATTNMLLRVPKSRRKKDLRVIAEMLEIDLNGAFSLKDIKSTILSEAKKKPELAKHLEAQENEQCHTSH